MRKKDINEKIDKMLSENKALADLKNVTNGINEELDKISNHIKFTELLLRQLHIPTDFRFKTKEEINGAVIFIKWDAEKKMLIIQEDYEDPRIIEKQFIHYPIRMRIKLAEYLDQFAIAFTEYLRSQKDL